MSVFQIQLAGITCPTIPHQKWFWTDAILIKNHNHIVLLRQARAGFCGIAGKQNQAGMIAWSQMQRPPSTSRQAPVIMSASSEQRKSAALAMSSG